MIKKNNLKSVPEVISVSQEAKDSLYGKYQELYNLFKNKDIAGIKSFVSLAAEDLSRDPSSKLTFEEAVALLGMMNRLQDSAVHLDEIVPLEYLHMELLNKDGTITRLVDSDGDYPIIFLENDGSLAYYVTTNFSKINGKWVEVYVPLSERKIK